MQIFLNGLVAAAGRLGRLLAGAKARRRRVGAGDLDWLNARQLADIGYGRQLGRISPLAPEPGETFEPAQSRPRLELIIGAAGGKIAGSTAPNGRRGLSVECVARRRVRSGSQVQAPSSSP